MPEFGDIHCPLGKRGCRHCSDETIVKIGYVCAYWQKVAGWKSAGTSSDDPTCRCKTCTDQKNNIVKTSELPRIIPLLPEGDTKDLKVWRDYWKQHDTAIAAAARAEGAGEEREKQYRFNSTEMLLLGHDEWKRREERRHLHPEDHWVTGFINGFLTDKKWAREYVDKLLRSQQPGGEDGGAGK